MLKYLACLLVTTLSLHADDPIAEIPPKVSLWKKTQENCGKLAEAGSEFTGNVIAELSHHRGAFAYGAAFGLLASAKKDTIGRETTILESEHKIPVYQDQAGITVRSVKDERSIDLYKPAFRVAGGCLVTQYVQEHLKPTTQPSTSIPVRCIAESASFLAGYITGLTGYAFATWVIK